MKQIINKRLGELLDLESCTVAEAIETLSAFPEGATIDWDGVISVDQLETDEEYASRIQQEEYTKKRELEHARKILSRYGEIK